MSAWMSCNANDLNVQNSMKYITYLYYIMKKIVDCLRFRRHDEVLLNSKLNHIIDLCFVSVSMKYTVQ